jgi:chorismate synthase
MPIIFSVDIKPTPSIPRPQQTVNLETGELTTIKIQGRHDPCIVPRAVPVVEAAAAIAIYDMILGNTQTDRRK